MPQSAACLRPYFSKAARVRVKSSSASSSTAASRTNSDSQTVLLGGDWAPAYRCSPGRAWSVLAPWGIGKPETRRTRLASWVSHERAFGLIRVPVPEPVEPQEDE